MLEVKNLYVNVEGKEILKGINLKVNESEIHAIMGPNGSGKSTLANVIAGREGYVIVSGEILFKGLNLLDMKPEDRAREGIFLAFQYPVEIPGISNATLLKTAVNELRKHRGEEELDAMEFLSIMKSQMKMLDMDEAMLSRSVNQGFSGGEKKRNEIFQMLILEPKLALLDETDSGLDIDALKIVSNGVNLLKEKIKDKAIVIVTHYQRLLNYIVPDFVHVLYDGQIVKSGGKELALELEDKGYDWLKNGKNLEPISEGMIIG
ncbi:MAG: Fe-S cluster assembly ATPase SufC [Bacteroidetes bacterium]|nr:Fe-S cluster assembly ATPase SufC [Bacteroidota bacterium]MBU2586384.1 Fe-S cluster assembly ATPase SufC [Bacteroidota bacterium]